MAWVLRLVEIGAEGEGSCADVVEISRPDGLVDIADLGLTLAEAKLVLAGVQREIVAAQARDHAVRRPGCRHCAGVCRVKDYRQHAIATLFGRVAGFAGAWTVCEQNRLLVGSALDFRRLPKRETGVGAVHRAIYRRVSDRSIDAAPMCGARHRTFSTFGIAEDSR